MSNFSTSQPNSEPTKTASLDQTEPGQPTSPSGIGIYDRPEQKGPSWVIAVGGLLLLLLVIALAIFVFQQIF